MENLTPFASVLSPLGDLRLQAEVRQDQSQLHVRYLATGKAVQSLFTPSAASTTIHTGNPLASPSRKEELWKTTCFELFLSPLNHQDYYELNFSPSGDWNSYHFDSYRKGMKIEPEMIVTKIDVQQKQDRFELRASVDLSKLQIATISELDVSITAVIQDKYEKLSFWALTHAGNEPDFHLRKSLTLKLRSSSS